MVSSFGGLQTAYSGLMAARDALNVTGQNIANAGTAGYSRQRLQAQSASAPAQATRVTLAQGQAGYGVIVTGVSRVSDDVTNGRVNSAAAQAGYADAQASALQTLEDGFDEPSDNGLSAQLQSFWASWQDYGNDPSTTASATTVIADANAVVSRIAQGYSAVQTQWSNTRSSVADLAGQVNAAADQIAKLNYTIQQTVASGSSANELMDQRDQLVNQLAQLAGGTSSQNADGTVNVLLAGNILVGGVTVNHVAVTGATDVASAGSPPVQLEWAQHPGQSVGVQSGQIAAELGLLAPTAPGGAGGVLAETAKDYNDLATALATQVNALHGPGSAQLTDGTPAPDFFAMSGTGPAALGISVAVTTPDQVAAAAPGSSAYDGSIADKISQLGTKAGSPDSVWSDLVGGVAVAAQNANRQQTLTTASLQSATAAQQSVSSVDTDQENIDMVTQQSAYQAAARVMTTVDQMLDTLINHTGVVGIA